MELVLFLEEVALEFLLLALTRPPGTLPCNLEGRLASRYTTSAAGIPLALMSIQLLLQPASLLKDYRLLLQCDVSSFAD